jgi:hypothetical protein
MTELGQLTPAEATYAAGKEAGLVIAADIARELADSPSKLLLAVGEMNAQELRTVRAVLRLVAVKIDQSKDRTP